MRSQITILEKANVGGADQTFLLLKTFFKKHSAHATTQWSKMFDEPAVMSDVSPRRLSLGDSCQEKLPFACGGHDLSPLTGVVETVGSAPEGDQLVNSGLSTEVGETIIN